MNAAPIMIRKRLACALPRSFTRGALVALAVAMAGGAHAGGSGETVQFGAGSGRTWLSGCELQAERYVVCKNAERPVLEAIANPGGGTPGEALQAFVRTLFEAKGCRFEAPAESFGVNGIFLSFDSSAAAGIACEGQRSALSFAPGRMSLLDTVYFLAEDPPPQ